MFFRKDKAPKKTPLKDTLAYKIALGIVFMQRKAASRLSRWEKHFSIKQKKILLLAFCLVGSISLLSILIPNLKSQDPAVTTPLENIHTTPVFPPVADTLKSFNTETP